MQENADNEDLMEAKLALQQLKRGQPSVYAVMMPNRDEGTVSIFVENRSETGRALRRLLCQELNMQGYAHTEHLNGNTHNYTVNDWDSKTAEFLMREQAWEDVCAETRQPARWR
jgi:hypothetical protein